MQHVPTFSKQGREQGNRRFALFVIFLLVLIAAALLVTIYTPQAFSPTVATGETYANPELWAYERYSFTTLPVVVGVVRDELASNPELMAFRQWQAQPAGVAASDFQHTNPEVDLFSRWQAMR